MRRHLIALPLLLAACGEAGRSPAEARSAEGATPPVAAPAARPSPTQSSSGPSPSRARTADDDLQATLDENDRIIAENNRLTAVIDRYGHEDRKKLDRLLAACQARTHEPTPDGAARRTMGCVEANWQGH